MEREPYVKWMFDALVHQFKNWVQLSCQIGLTIMFDYLHRSLNIAVATDKINVDVLRAFFKGNMIK